MANDKTTKTGSNKPTTTRKTTTAKPETKSAIITFKLTPELKAKAIAKADALGVTLSEVMENALVEATTKKRTPKTTA